MHSRQARIALSLLLALGSRSSSAQSYGVARTGHDVMIPTRDGARMATDIFRPARNGVPVDERLPVLLIRTPYDKGTAQKDAEYFARHGYVVATQDVRGRYRS